MEMIKILRVMVRGKTKKECEDYFKLIGSAEGVDIEEMNPIMAMIGRGHRKRMMNELFKTDPKTGKHNDPDCPFCKIEHEEARYD